MGPTWPQAEGFILGVGAKMFTIAGPVIVYGVSASVVYGLIYWITTLFWNRGCKKLNFYKSASYKKLRIPRKSQGIDPAFVGNYYANFLVLDFFYSPFFVYVLQNLCRHNLLFCKKSTKHTCSAGHRRIRNKRGNVHHGKVIFSKCNQRASDTTRKVIIILSGF